jgi:hypothetical protein
VVNALALFVALAAAAMAPQAQALDLRYQEGVARNPRTSAVLYREQHWLRSDGDRLVERLVLYRCPDGIVFARKRIDYRASAVAPAFEYVDARSGYREGLRRTKGVELFYRPDGNSAELSAPVRAAQLVVDAGFDEYIRANWNALVAGKTVPLEFAIPSRLRSMGFSVSRFGATRIAGEPAWQFRLKLSGWLGLIVPAIDVSYGQQSRRLLRFEGMSSLRDDAGRKPLMARIDFPAPARAANDAQWQAALQTPLSVCKSGH